MKYVYLSTAQEAAYNTEQLHEKIDEKKRWEKEEWKRKREREMRFKDLITQQADCACTLYNVHP